MQFPRWYIKLFDAPHTHYTVADWVRWTVFFLVACAILFWPRGG
jgi:hypothetical protein